MEDKLGDLQDYLSNKQQHLLTFTSTTSDMTFNFPVPISLISNRNYKVGLLWFSAYNTIFNINKTNNLLHYGVNTNDNNWAWHIVEFQPGAYEINQINAEVQRQLKRGNKQIIEIGIDRATSKTTLNIPTGMTVSFDGIRSIGEILGFNKRGVREGFHRSDNIAQITSISTINVECSIIQNSYLNGKQSNILYSFPSYTVPVGYKIVERISHPIYLPVSNTSSISSIKIRIIDEKHNLISFNGEEISLAIELKQV